MSWFLRRLEVFLAAATIALSGAFASQTQPFITQYLQRTHAQLDEAQATLDEVRNGLRYRVMSETVRGELETSAATRVETLDKAYNAVFRANPLVRPISLLRRGDPKIVAETRAGFAPAMPLSRGSIAFGLFGMIAGFAVYELIRLPVMVIAREPRRRRFRRRG